MSNLSELLPAGGAAKEFEPVASGTLPNGQAVVLKSNGQVEAVAETSVSASVGSALSIDGPSSNYTRVTMLSATKAIAVYLDAGDTDDGYAVALTISGSSITAGTPVAFNPAGSYYNRIDKISSTQAIVVYKDLGNSNYGTSCILTLSGTSITAGSEVVFNSGRSDYTTVAVLNSTKAIVVYGDNSNSHQCTACLLTISGSSITAGSEVGFNSNRGRYFSITSLTETKAIVTFEQHNDTAGKACILDVSGTTITAGSVQQFTAGAIYNTSVTALSSTKAIVVYQASPHAAARVLDVSGTTITAGSALEYRIGTTSFQNIAKLTSTRAIVSYKDNANNSYPTYATFTISGATVTLESTVVISSTASTDNGISTGESQQAIFVYGDSSNNSNITARTIQTAYTSTNLTSTNFVGITAEAITSGATGVVVPQGGVAASVANIDIVQLYGSEAVFNPGTSPYVSAAFDPNSSKFVVVYRDSSNSNYGTACVGTISGNSISFGSEVVFNSATTGYIYIDFDPNSSGKFVVVYKDDGNSRHGTAIVGTVSGTSISYGSEVVFAAAVTDPTAISFDSNASGKFVIFYSDGDNSNYGTAIVGTLSGTSTSYGSEVVFNSISSSHQSAEFDPNTANKIVVSYRDGGNSGAGTAVVGTVSGTSISFGSSSVFNSGNTSYTSVSFDPNTSGRFIVAYRDAGNSNYGTSCVGTVSGTSISFGSGAIFNAGNASYPSVSFDPNTANKYVIAYMDTGNSSYGTAIVGNLSTALTIGSNYYVQADGTVSTVSTSPAVHIGKAISATSLILKG